MTDLGTLGGPDSWVYGNGINNAGEVVGGADTATGAYHGFLYTNGLMQDLNSLIPADSGWEILDAKGINDTGQIAATGINPEGYDHAVLLTPGDQTTPTGKPGRADRWLPGRGGAVAHVQHSGRL